MGILSALTGNAGEVSTAGVQRSLGPILVPGEVVHKAYQVGRDQLVFKDRRLVLVDR